MIELCPHVLGFLFVGVHVGGIGPSDEEVVREGLFGYFFAEFIKQRVVFKTHDVTEIV